MMFTTCKKTCVLLKKVISGILIDIVFNPKQFVVSCPDIETTPEPSSPCKYCPILSAHHGSIYVFWKVLTNSVCSHEHAKAGNTTGCQTVKLAEI